MLSGIVKLRTNVITVLLSRDWRQLAKALLLIFGARPAGINVETLADDKDGDNIDDANDTDYDSNKGLVEGEIEEEDEKIVEDEWCQSMKRSEQYLPTSRRILPLISTAKSSPPYWVRVLLCHTPHSRPTFHLQRAQSQQKHLLIYLRLLDPLLLLRPIIFTDNILCNNVSFRWQGSPRVHEHFSQYTTRYFERLSGEIR